MKKLFGILVLASALFLNVPMVHAQDSCTFIDSSNADICCSRAENAAQCSDYIPTAQQVGGGTQVTTPVNTGNTALTNVGVDPAAQNIANACSAIKFNTLLDIAIWVKCIIGSIVIPGIFTLAFVVFLWGVFKFMRSSESKDKQESKQFIYMGLIGLFVMTSVWGIIKILGDTAGIDSTFVPALQTSSLDISKASKK